MEAPTEFVASKFSQLLNLLRWFTGKCHWISKVEDDLKHSLDKEIHATNHIHIGLYSSSQVSLWTVYINTTNYRFYVQNKKNQRVFYCLQILIRFVLLRNFYNDDWRHIAPDTMMQFLNMTLWLAENGIAATDEWVLPRCDVNLFSGMVIGWPGKM